LIVPTVASPPVVPFTCHVTAVLLALLTVAVKCAVNPAGTVAVAGEMVMETGAGGVVPPPPPPPPHDPKANATNERRSTAALFI
jgi:hypothetical protein